MSTPRSRPGRGAQRIRTRPRTLLACVNCKERKLKCDDRIPTCGNCQRLNIACLVEDPTTKRHQTRNYVESLEERVAFLESLLQQVRPDLAEDHITLPDDTFSGADNQSTSPLTSSQFANGESPQTRLPQASAPHGEDDAVSDLATKVGMLGLNATGAEPHYLGSSSTFAFSRLISSSLLRGLPIKHDRAYDASRENQDSLFPSVLSDYHVAVTLSNAYFNNIHPQYPFLHEATFRAWERELAFPSETLDALSPVALFFLYMVYAVGALLLPRSGCSPEGLYTTAQLYLDQVLPLENLEAVQALLCCAMYSLRSPVGPSVWKLSGLALRQCIELGYHRSARRFGSTANPLRLELRRRAFWCAYILDCAGAITLGRPLGIPHQEVDAEFPLDIDDCHLTNTAILGTARQNAADPPTSMSVAVHVCRLRRLWALIHTTLYSDTNLSSPAHPTYQTRVQQLRGELEAWRTSIPPLPQHVGEQLSLFANADWFEVNYSYSILLLYRGELTENKDVIADEICLQCLKAAKSICHGYRRQFVGRSVGYTWGALHFLLLAGLTYLHCLWISQTARKATRPDDVSSACTDCTMVLTVMAERWKEAAPYRDIFEVLASRTITMMVDVEHDDWITSLGTSAVQSGSAAEGDLTQWMTDIVGASSSDEMDTFLTGLMGDLPARRELGASGPEDRGTFIDRF
ncbi:hypothetical protein H2200_003571 [Cladophialophora chaetospira]|uniref:Zn(2)-C6 fungal-type domain-containing protein n=1 Tax=Cladophialophora chaetospira TaxID=386627 RepID=A0AA39CL57_9EURO|nr:hypothetical protein H2200_003571 [Cladophialophora chaetospira]